MYSLLQADLLQLAELLDRTRREATIFLEGLAARPVAGQPRTAPFRRLPVAGTGAQTALTTFLSEYGAALSASAGPRYLGFVTGGATPAAVAGDWLVSAFDQSLSAGGDSVATHVERETLALLQELLGLPASFRGSFVTGATMANFVSLAVARQWAGHRAGVNVAQAGTQQLPALPIFSAAAHSSTVKSLAMLGLGRDCLRPVATLPGSREAIDVAALETALQAQHGQPAVVVASAGTVNTADFDDLAAIGRLKVRYPFWLHVDAAFGAFAACSPQYAHLLEGLDAADSVTVDAHKWLNVPYDAAMQYTRPEHAALQVEVFQNSASYLTASAEVQPDFYHLTPENSRRFRALPAWCSLVAYGRAGYREVVERNCQLAQELSRRLDASPHFALLAPTRLNIVCFTRLLPTGPGSAADIGALQQWLAVDGRVLFTPTVFQGQAGLRAAFSNWRTEAPDVDIAWQALTAAVAALAGWSLPSPED